MADPVASVEKIVKLGLAIKEAVDTVRHNEEECREIRKRVLRFSDILSQLQQTGMMNDSPAMSGALEDLEESLHQGLELVMACQERSAICRLISAGDLSKQLRRVKEDILNKVMLASFAINAHTTIILLTFQAGGHPPLRLPEDTEVIETSCNSHSTNDARSKLNYKRNNVPAEAPFPPLLGLREFKLFELEAATSNFSHDNIIGRGGGSIVYKGVLNDGYMVAIKKILDPDRFNWARTLDTLLIVSKLQHKNIIKILGYVKHKVRTTSSPSVVWFFKRREYFLVEEYAVKISLHNIILGSGLDWSSLFQIIEGVAQGMHCLHEHGIVHLDLKPGNILLDSDMNPKIIDFGISEVLHGNKIYTHGNAIRGTMGYIAPEHIADGIVSKKNDVYAFGMTVVETIGSILISKAHREYPLDRWAWDSREYGMMDELFHPARYNDKSQLMEIKRCVEVALLCTQSNPADRPPMEDVLQMLSGLKELTTPKKPSYITTRKIGFYHQKYCSNI